MSQRELDSYDLVNLYADVLIQPKWRGHFVRTFAVTFIRANGFPDPAMGEQLREAARFYAEKFQLKNLHSKATDGTN